MSTVKADSLELDPDLGSRLAELAAREGTSLAEFAERVLRAYADEAERTDVEAVDDEKRWQAYLQSRHAVPFEAVRQRLGMLRDEARAKSARR
ncbi:hypothetical protein [Jiella avicenniae]|uniref:Ribbon-helix-helix protein, copG family n=1 Tax=Jiella avicenniae TaxID=2907202 RepID=A0A9X1T4Y4_9HYPH|nr:hypothetical protein [Jiella avicenniae]MCE7028512.1 hypothetical protein [Jiella avicenniae]